MVSTTTHNERHELLLSNIMMLTMLETKFLILHPDAGHGRLILNVMGNSCTAGCY